ncbi:hypothetical protein CFP56_013294 [Quercus suber]|uniref:Uncharacterized protein n=1 Tax=Quercus suber TaxID=58331 RepID=A0AAW0KVF0_QUESU
MDPPPQDELRQAIAGLTAHLSHLEASLCSAKRILPKGIVMKLQKSISNKIKYFEWLIFNKGQNILLCSKLLITLVVLIMTNKGYRPASNDLNIIFLLTTSVKECNEESELIPMHAFEFATYNCINNRLNDNSYLTDMIGKLTAIGPIEQVHCDSSSTNIKNLQILLPDMDGKADIKLLRMNTIMLFDLFQHVTKNPNLNQN